jgi:Hint domain
LLRPCFGAFSNFGFSKMTATDTIVDLNLFRRIRQSLSEVTHRPSRSVDEVKATDWYLSGFCGKERVGTTFGDLPIEALRARDELRTYDGSTATVQVVDKLKLDWSFLRDNPRALPIRIPANSFGPGKPMLDILVSPGQEICPDLHVAATFVKAQKMEGRFRMDFTQNTGLTYFRFHCGRSAVVKVEGIWVRTQPW